MCVHYGRGSVGRPLCIFPRFITLNDGLNARAVAYSVHAAAYCADDAMRPRTRAFAGAHARMKQGLGFSCDDAMDPGAIRFIQQRTAASWHRDEFDFFSAISDAHAHEDNGKKVGLFVCK